MALWSAVGAFVLLVGVGGVAVLSLSGDSRGSDGGIPIVEQSGQVAVSDGEIENLVDGHTSALGRRSEREFLSIYDSGDKKLIASQRRLYENLLKVPFEVAEFQVAQQAGRRIDSFGRGVRFTLDVAFVHQISKVDVRPVQEWYHWTVVKETRDDPLTVTAVSGATTVHGEKRTVYYPAPWDVYPDMTVVETPHTVILASAETARLARRLKSTAERSATADLNVWKSKGPKGVLTQPGFLVVLENNRKRYGTMYRAGESIATNEAGFSLGMAAARTSRRDKVAFGGARIVVDTTTSFFTSHGRAGTPREIFRHEMAHSLLQPLEAEPGVFDDLLGKGLQTWVVEGFADYMALRGVPASRNENVYLLRRFVRGGHFDGTLPTNEEINNGKKLSGVAYAQGYFAIRFIADEYGERKALAFVAAHYQDPQRLGREIREATGLSLRGFQARWARYVRAAVR